MALRANSVSEHTLLFLCMHALLNLRCTLKDAGAKHVEVKLKEFGLDLIEVSDNGSGVSPSDYEGLALKYHTSKLSTFSDLCGVTSFGFRGEALSSLCELAGSFTVTTRTAGESVGVKLTYGRDGNLLGKVTCWPLQDNGLGQPFADSRLRVGCLRFVFGQIAFL